MKRRVVRIHWWRAKNVWSIVFSDHCEHYKKLIIKAPLESVLQDQSPRAYFKGKIAIKSNGDSAEIY